jgi:transposase
MLVELRVAEQRLRAVWEVLDGASVTEVARRFKVSRQSVHVWLRRYAADQGLGDRSSRPHGCPHQMSPVTEAKIVEIRRAHPGWGADRIGYQRTAGWRSTLRPAVRDADNVGDFLHAQQFLVDACGVGLSGPLGATHGVPPGGLPVVVCGCPARVVPSPQGPWTGPCGQW